MPDGSAAREQRHTVGEALRWASDRLRGVRTPSLDAELLLGHVLGKDRSWLIGHPDFLLNADQLPAFNHLVMRRSHGEPVAHLRGFVDWWNLRLEVNADVLIPRPETEILVEQAIDLGRRIEAREIADIGTGSGAIAIALARALPQARLQAVDISPEALNVAHRNVRCYDLEDRIQLLHGRLLEPIARRPDLIAANLPYLSDEMMARLDADVQAEPESALHGGGRGTEIYAELFEQLQNRVWKTPVLMEIDPRQADELRQLVAGTLPWATVRFVSDLAAYERVLIIEHV